MVDLGADINAKVSRFLQTQNPGWWREGFGFNTTPLFQEQHNGRSSLHLAVDQQSLDLVKLLLRKGADPNLLSSGGHTPFQLTYGLDNCDIRKELFLVTRPELRDLCESDNSGEESSEEESDTEVCWNRRWSSKIERIVTNSTSFVTSSPIRVFLQVMMYDDFRWNGQ